MDAEVTDQDADVARIRRVDTQKRVRAARLLLTRGSAAELGA
jgi:hypothetical protein